MNLIWYQFHGESWGVLPNFFLVFHSTRLETTRNLSLNHSAAGICMESGQGPSIFAFEVSPNPSKNKVPGSMFTKGLGMMCDVYRVTRRVFSKSVTSKLHILFQKILAGSLKTLKVTRISAMYTNFSHPPVHSGPSKFSRPKIWNWSLGNTKANKNLVND